MYKLYTMYNQMYTSRRYHTLSFVNCSVICIPRNINLSNQFGNTVPLTHCNTNMMVRGTIPPKYSICINILMSWANHHHNHHRVFRISQITLYS